jgi:hypothetical protein
LRSSPDDESIVVVNPELRAAVDEILRGVEVRLDAHSKSIDDRFADQAKTIDDRFADQTKTIDDRFADQTKTIDDRLAEQAKSIDDRLADRARVLEDRFVTARRNTINDVSQMLVAQDARTEQRMQVHFERMEGLVRLTAEGFGATLGSLDRRMDRLERTCATRFIDYDRILGNHNERIGQLERLNNS